MLKIRYALVEDKAFWFTLDAHLKESEFLLKVRDRRGYIILAEDNPIGILRYNLFWDEIPFLTMICLVEAQRGKGFGQQVMRHWEAEMRKAGHKMVMTSTMVSEQAQHFYRKLGYLERGSLFLDNTPIEQPQEMLMIKIL